MAEELVAVMYYLNEAETFWIAKGRPNVPAAPGTPPPPATAFLLDDPASLLDGTKVLV